MSTITSAKHVLVLLTLALWAGALSAQAAADADCPTLLQYEHNKLRSEQQINFCDNYKGKVLLVINTASQCGYTSQFSGLQKLYQEYRDDGLVLLGFPSADFRQEYTSEEDIAKVCYVNYGVTFPMLSESSVKGADANPFFQNLQRQGAPSPNWNFNKFLIDRRGKFIAHYPSSIRPDSQQLRDAIERQLNSP